MGLRFVRVLSPGAKVRGTDGCSTKWRGSFPKIGQLMLAVMMAFEIQFSNLERSLCGCGWFTTRARLATFPAEPLVRIAKFGACDVNHVIDTAFVNSSL